MLYVGDEQRDVARVKGWCECNLGILGYDVIETLKRCTGLYGSYTDGNCASSTRSVFLI